MHHSKHDISELALKVDAWNLFIISSRVYAFHSKYNCCEVLVGFYLLKQQWEKLTETLEEMFS